MAANPSKVVFSGSPKDDLSKEKEAAEAQAQLEYEKNIKKLEDTLPASELNALKEFGQSLGILIPQLVRLTGNYLDYSELETCGKIMPP